MNKLFSSAQLKNITWVLCVAAMKELSFWLLPDSPVLQTIIKLLAGAAVFFICTGFKKKPSDRLHTLILISVIIFILADLVIKWQFIVSGALFFIGHLLLIIGFWKQQKPGKKALLIWLVITIVEAPLVFLLLRSYQFSILIGSLAALYGSILTLMVVSAFKVSQLLTIAACAFVASDLFLALHKASASLIWMHVPSILLFYFSLGLFLLY